MPTARAGRGRVRPISLHGLLGLLLLGAAAGACQRGSDRVGPLPGAAPFPPSLAGRLADALAHRGPDYRPHTRHLLPDRRPRYTNRLLLEASPYLLQHAHNPVDWYPWGDEAFERARREHKPVLLSVGYATCHWCHVMEEESFEDEEIAAVLNQRYVAIKVDREQRPDVDGVYMAAVQLLSGGGGWPMTVWLTPDRQPFFAGTYFPPRDGARGMATGFLTLLQRLADEYAEDPGGVAAHAAGIAAHLAEAPARPAGDLPGVPAIRAAVDQLRAIFDPVWGGFGRAPKFPRPSTLELLLRYHRRTGDAPALQMVTTTLERMAAGGIYDQLGGGFHRYATDARWLVPHFEKMLYDNALLALVYLEAYQASGREDFARVARETLDYVEREMAAPAGGFFSATDADSEGTEGAYFVWTPEEIDAAAGPGRGRLVRAYYGVTPQASFHDGRSILWRPRPLADAAREAGVAPEAMAEAVEQARPLLLAARARRVPPATDRNVLVDWNGLMIYAFARGGLVLGEPRWVTTARRAADFLLTRARREGRLPHAISDGRTVGAAYLDDYAFLIAALLDLFESDPDPRWLRSAIDLQAALDAGFADAAGGYFFTAVTHETLLARDKPDYDGALPAGNSVAALDLLRLAEYTGDDRYRQRAASVFRAFAGAVTRAPLGLPRLLVALDYFLDRPKEVVIVAPAGTDAAPLVARLRRAFVPNRVVVAARADGARAELERLAPVVAEKVPLGGRPTAYVCEAMRCELPTADPAVFERQLKKVEPLPG